MGVDRKLLIGYYGAGNIGDELIIRQYLIDNPETQFIIFSYGETYSQSNILSVYYWRQSQKLYNFLLYFKALMLVNEVRWIGGTCFTDEDGDGGFKYMIIARLFGRQISYINIGINPLKSLKRIITTKLILTLARSISTRDLQSHELASCYIIKYFGKDNLSTSVSRDLGERYFEGLPCRIARNRNLLIAWRVLRKYSANEGELIASLVSLAKNIINSFDNIYIINADSSKDKQTSGYIYYLLNSFGNVHYFENLSTDDKLKLISESSHIITSRLHVGIFGGLLKRETFVYNYSKKIEYYHNNNPRFRIFKHFSELKEYWFTQ